MFFKRYAARAAIRDSTQICASCYAVCNAAYLQAQVYGETPVLCEADNAFFQNLTTCQTCQGSNLAEISVNSPVTTEFEPFILYCEEQNATQSDNPWTSVVSQASAISALNSQASSLGYSLVNTVTGACTTTTSPATTGPTMSAPAATSPTPTPTTNPTPTPTPQPQSHAWIAGAVVGPLAAVASISLVFFFIRRRRHHRLVPTEEPGDESYKDKAQLHSESLPAKQELSGDSTYPELGANTKQIAELPGVEISPLELPTSPTEPEADQGDATGR
ncbi:hypothetical protein BDZ45DRAFT_307257 [Acephala macrosclerotiorum]|nr:hypothetical protein BDZ45DRAFT_307257 [Acephala macrosclerotiorum]